VGMLLQPVAFVYLSDRTMAAVVTISHMTPREMFGKVVTSCVLLIVHGIMKPENPFLTTFSLTLRGAVLLLSGQFDDLISGHPWGHMAFNITCLSSLGASC